VHVDVHSLHGRYSVRNDDEANVGMMTIK
jgi:hypothetical protein